MILIFKNLENKTKMSVIKIVMFSLFAIGLLLLAVYFVSISSEPKIVTLKCSPEFWANNLELWEIVGINYNDSFDEIFGRDYFDPDITLEQAINKQGVGMDHLARSGTAAHLNSLADPEIDEENIRRAVNFGYIHQIDNYLSNCNEVKKEVSFFD